jgi:lipopolysaccharide/colanic/teichoic acid biosynthesis glycosyltransferase
MSVFPGRSETWFSSLANIELSPPCLAGAKIPRPRFVSLAFKRAFDVVGATALLLILSPLLPALALAIRLDGGPALFSHVRIGFNGRPFGCLKYRTMALEADRMLARHLATDPLAAIEWATQRKLTADPRVTRLGRLLRSTSLDELPQLLNVLRGQMSLIGPRPVVEDELEQHYGPAGRAAYATTRPGITGLWQISGRSGTTYNERVELDMAYVAGWSLLLDMKILLRTIPVVLTRRGAQ